MVTHKVRLGSMSQVRTGAKTSPDLWHCHGLPSLGHDGKLGDGEHGGESHYFISSPSSIQEMMHGWHLCAIYSSSYSFGAVPHSFECQAPSPDGTLSTTVFWKWACMDEHLKFDFHHPLAHNPDVVQTITYSCSGKKLSVKISYK